MKFVIEVIQDNSFGIHEHSFRFTLSFVFINLYVQWTLFRLYFIVIQPWCFYYKFYYFPSEFWLVINVFQLIYLYCWVYFMFLKSALYGFLVIRVRHYLLKTIEWNNANFVTILRNLITFILIYNKILMYYYIFKWNEWFILTCYPWLV